MVVVRHPPGRSGRVWLVHRLAAARRAADLLDSKLQILRREQQRFTELAERSRAEWASAVAEARRWVSRAAAVGGERCLRPEPALEPAEVEIAWSAVMGVRYPASAGVRAGSGPGAGGDHTASATGTRVAATAALPLAAAAYRRALDAAVAHSAADAACRVVAGEVDVTRRRLRAIETRWVPRLEEALTDLDRSLSEAERADAVRARWATRPRPARTRVARVDRLQGAS